MSEIPMYPDESVENERIEALQRLDWPAFWRSLPPREMMEAAKAMPKIAGAWTDFDDGSGWRRVDTATGREIAWGSPTYGVRVYALPATVVFDLFPDRASADAALRAADWILVDEETTT